MTDRLRATFILLAFLYGMTTCLRIALTAYFCQTTIGSARHAPPGDRRPDDQTCLVFREGTPSWISGEAPIAETYSIQDVR